MFVVRAWPFTHRRSLYRAYAETVIEGDDCRIWTGRGALRLGPDRWHVITAWNPMSVKWGIEDNRVANELLRADLDPAFEVVDVTAKSPDGNWSEVSFALRGATREAVCRLGVDYRQNAVFELDDRDQRVIRCEDGRVVARRPRGRSTGARTGADL